jgi:hypothetical protein
MKSSSRVSVRPRRDRVEPGTPIHQPRRSGWDSGPSPPNALPPSPLHPDLAKLFSAFKEARAPTGINSQVPELDPGNAAALVTEAQEYADRHMPKVAELEAGVRGALASPRKQLAARITGLLLITRRAQLVAVLLAKHNHPAAVSAGDRLKAAQEELRLARWRATDTRKRALTRLRLAHPKFSKQRLVGLVERDRATLMANAVHFFARHIRNTCMEHFNAHWSGLSDPQDHVRMPEERAWMPLLLHELRYDFDLELQEIVDVVTHAQVVGGAKLDLDAVSKMLARSTRQR